MALLQITHDGFNLQGDKDELDGLFSAMCAMVLDVHAPQDMLTLAQWIAAESLFKLIEKAINDSNNGSNPPSRA